MPVEYVESVLALAGPKIVGKTFNVASALGADIASGSWGNALSNVMSKAENLGIVPKTEMYVVEPKQGLGSLGAKPFAEAESGIAALLKDYKPTNTPLLDSLLAKEKPAMSLVDSLLKDYKPADPIPAGVKSQVKTSVDNVYTGLAKDAPSVPMSEFLQTLVYGGASLKDVGTAVDLAMQGSGGGGGTNTPDAIIQEVSKATEKLDDAIKVPATFAFLVNAGILGVTPSTAIESGWVTDTGELTDAGTKYLAETQPYPQEQLQPAQQEQPALQTETQPLLKEPVNKFKEFEDPPAPPPPKPPTPPPPLPPTVYPLQQPPVSKSEEIDPVDGESIDVTAIEGDPESPANKAKAKKQSKLRFNQSLGKALQAVQVVSAKTPPGAEIDYLYDIGGESIFAPMRKQRPRQDWAYEPNDRFAQGGITNLLRSK
jgi:outer membrane biosynthesis protein TonB